MCCLNVWPSASLQLYIVAHCDKQLHAPGLTRPAKAVFATKQLTQVKSALFVIGSELPRHYCTIIGCVMRTCVP